MKVYVIRHGESENNVKKHWTGWMDVPLTEKGRMQASRTARYLTDVPFDRVYASDLIRACDTAELALPGCTYEKSALLREINVGSLAGHPVSCLSEEEYKKAHADGYAEFGGESKAELRQRTADFMKLLENSGCGNVAVFCHAGWIRTMLDLVVGTPVKQKSLLCGNCTIGIFEFTGTHWRLHSWINHD